MERKSHYSARSRKGVDKIMGEDKELGERQLSNVVTLSYLLHCDYVHTAQSLNDKL
jgi:hypothetical protein